MSLASNCLQITSLIRKKSYRWLPLKKLAKAHFTDTGVFMLLPQCYWSNLLKGTCLTGTGVIIYLPKSSKCYWINLLEREWVNTWNHYKMPIQWQQNNVTKPRPCRMGYTISDFKRMIHCTVNICGQMIHHIHFTFICVTYSHHYRHFVKMWIYHTLKSVKAEKMS